MSKNHRNNFAIVDAGALQMAVNVLQTAGKLEVLDELAKATTMGLPPLPLDIQGLYNDWAHEITNTNTLKINTPIGITISSTGRVMLTFSLTNPEYCSSIENAHEKVYRHFVLSKFPRGIPGVEPLVPPNDE